MIRALLWTGGAVLAGMTAVAAWNLASARRMHRAPRPRSLPRVSVLLPARDEEHNVGAALDALARSDYPALEIVVLDDGSRDATRPLAEARAAADPRIRVLEGSHPPAGWVGKPWACRQLAAAATGEILIFCDADVRAGPRAVTATVGLLESTGAGALTALPRQVVPRWWESALVPLITQLPVLWLLPLRLVERSGRPALAMGNGQWLALTREVYARAGGHDAVGDRVLEDVALARAVKASGGRLVVALAPHDLEVRMYGSLAEMRTGFRKNVYALLGGRPGALSIALVGWTAAMLVPLLAPFLPGRAVWLPLGALTLLRLAGVVALRHPLHSVLLHPIGALAAPLVALESALAARTGSATWKGRPLPREERVVLVDEHDRVLGTREKLDAHRRPALHRAFSVFVMNGAGELLLQRRAAGKYHSPGLWTNSACGHPRPGEPTEAAARRRLREEMGIDCALTPAGSFIYRAELGGGLTEHELDHVFVGRAEGAPEPDPNEAGDWRWVPLPEVERWLAREPHAFTAWFAPALDRVRAADAGSLAGGG